MNTFVLLASLIPIFLMGGAIVFIAPKIRSKIGSLITWKRSLLIAGIYLGILVISVPVLYLLPDRGLIKLVETSQEAVNLQELHVGDFDWVKQQGLHKNSSQTFPIDTDKLTFKVDENIGNYHISVERKDADDGKIDVHSYAGTQMAMGIDLTKLVTPPIITLQKGTLVLKSSQQRFDFKRFEADFTAEHFKNLKRSEKGIYTHFGMKIIIIQVPKSIDIDKGNYNGQIEILSST